MKISYALRAFAIYFIILGLLSWFTLDNAIERLNDGMRQSAESVLVDMVNVVASFIEDEIQQPDALPTEQLNRIASLIKQRTFEAEIYQVLKNKVDSHIYVTDHLGKVLFDSSGENVGADFSLWRDVSLTLSGEYGARTSFIDPNATAPDDPQVMVVAAPIQHRGKIVGVVSVSKPIASLAGHLLTETEQLQRYAFFLLAFALLLGYLLSLWFTHSLNKIADYADGMADGKQISPPTLRDTRLTALTESISHLRSQLDGKEYVENYIHSLTHELKTPITSIRGAVELLNEDMPLADRTRFLHNIDTSNQRMSRLVERMLSLAKLEGQTESVPKERFDLTPLLNRLIEERSTMLSAKKIKLVSPDSGQIPCVGDRILISQAIANLLDNAMDFCYQNGRIEITLKQIENQFRIAFFNEGDPIPDFALSKIYDRFFSLPRPGDQPQTGKSTGLGLSFVKEIMKRHNGHVHVSNTDSGVLATLAWPFAPQPSN